jgi:uncharacterized protein (TIGR00375 family)
MHAFADLHLHSRFAIASSPSMTPGPILRACSRKGISVVGSGDALHEGWRRLWEPFLENPGGIVVVPSGELEDRDRVHHLVLMEDFAGFEDLGDRLGVKSAKSAWSGRPHFPAGGEEIASAVHRCGGLIGPAHAFTPWTAMYASFDRVSECYGTERIDYLELGLSADSSYAAGIPDLYGIPFLTNSDAHSPDVNRFGREFTELVIAHRNARSVLSAVRMGKIAMNVGFFPEEGKYNRTACTRCYLQYSPEEAARLSWRCPADGGLIKKGVYDRARELSTGPARERPAYLPMIPLGELIAKTLGLSSPHTKKAGAVYDRLVGTFGTEIEVLLRIPAGEISGVDPRVGSAVDSLRNRRVRLSPGGGGKYGTFEFE